MAPVATKANPLLTTVPWRRIKFRTICGGRISHAPSSSSAQSTTSTDSGASGKKFSRRSLKNSRSERGRSRWKLVE
ncbi:polyribonucleotide nucleotidyltransferase [Salvia divinorum]|uniref:Polyribonucleotide nucleotidyltransferase n=1 Tax=Salvia divinorum TaxID=28513 RepID=A0ABD1G037_SALDI